MEPETIEVILNDIKADIGKLQGAFEKFSDRCDARHADGDRYLSNTKNGIYKTISGITKETADLTTRVAVLQIKAGMWGAIAGAVPSLAAVILLYIKFGG